MIFDLLLKLSPALENGKTLKNPETWGNVSNTAHALIIVFGFLLVAAKQFGYDIPISDAQLVELAGAIASVGGTVVAFLHVVTTPNKGIKR